MYAWLYLPRQSIITEFDKYRLLMRITIRRLQIVYEIAEKNMAAQTGAQVVQEK